MSFTVGLMCPHGAPDSSGKATCTCKTIQGRLSIWTAAEYGLIDAIRESIGQDFTKVNACDSYGYTPLHYAAQHNKVDVVRLLIQRKADVNAQACGATPLHRAAAANAVESSQLLIEAGADVNARDTSFSDQRTPLMKAASYGYLDIVKVILNSGKANEAAQDAQGYTTWDLAVSFPQIRKLLKAKLDDTSSNVYETKVASSALDKNIVTETPQVPSPTVPLLACSECKVPALFMRNLNGSLICRVCADRISGED